MPSQKLFKQTLPLFEYTMNTSGCFILTWDTGFAHHHYSTFETLREHLEYYYKLEELTDIYSIRFNNKHAIIPDYEFNYDQKHMQINRILRDFFCLAINTGSILCNECSKHD